VDSDRADHGMMRFHTASVASRSIRADMNASFHTKASIA